MIKIYALEDHSGCSVKKGSRRVRVKVDKSVRRIILEFTGETTLLGILLAYFWNVTGETMLLGQGQRWQETF